MPQRLNTRVKRSLKHFAKRHGALLVEWQHANYLEPHLARILSGLDVDVVVDVGANVGQFGTLLRRDVGYAGRIVSFEPTQRSYHSLVQASRSDDRWDVHQLAVGATAATAKIHHYRHSSMDSLLTPTDYGVQRFASLREVDGTEQIEIVRLDEMLADLPGRRLFLKTDTQGYDLEVLKGAHGIMDRVVGLTLEASVKPIYEGMPSILDSLTVAESLGFELTGLFPITRDADSLSLVEADCVFRRRDGDGLLGGRRRVQDTRSPREGS